MCQLVCCALPCVCQLVCMCQIVCARAQREKEKVGCTTHAPFCSAVGAQTIDHMGRERKRGVHICKTQTHMSHITHTHRRHATSAASHRDAIYHRWAHTSQFENTKGGCVFCSSANAKRARANKHEHQDAHTDTRQKTRGVYRVTALCVPSLVHGTNKPHGPTTVKNTVASLHLINTIHVIVQQTHDWRGVGRIYILTARIVAHCRTRTRPGQKGLRKKTLAKTHTRLICLKNKDGTIRASYTCGLPNRQ